MPCWKASEGGAESEVHSQNSPLPFGIFRGVPTKITNLASYHRALQLKCPIFSGAGKTGSRFLRTSLQYRLVSPFGRVGGREGLLLLPPATRGFGAWKSCRLRALSALLLGPLLDFMLSKRVLITISILANTQSFLRVQLSHFLLIDRGESIKEILKSRLGPNRSPMLSQSDAEVFKLG